MKRISKILLAVVLVCTPAVLVAASMPVGPLFPAQMRMDSRRPTEPEGQITTEVEDPRHPKEPWIVTTYRLPDESAEAHVRRHMASVEAVRSALR